MIPDSYLRRRDPTLKLAVALVLSVLLFLVIDPVTPFLFLIATIAAGALLGRVRPTTYAWALAPLALIALGFVWTNALFARATDPTSVLWSWGPIRATLSGLLFGLAIGARGLAIGALSVTFVLTTDPTDLIISLIRNARLPFRVGYPLLAAYRFLPFFRDERERIALAQRVRGQLHAPTPLGRLGRSGAFVVPLLATAVRKAAAIAVAMDARGFAAARDRTYLRRSAITRNDFVFVAGAIAFGLSLLALGAFGGWLRLWDGRFAA